MFSIFRKLGSANVGASLRCPRCRSTQIKRIDEQGDVDVYRCLQQKVHVVTNEKRRCGVVFRYIRTPLPMQYPAEDVKSRPELLLGPTARKEIMPLWSYMNRLKPQCGSRKLKGV